MSEYKIGFIGTGNMGSAIARAVRKVLPGHEIILSNRTAAKAQALADELNCRFCCNATDMKMYFSFWKKNFRSIQKR